MKIPAMVVEGESRVEKYCNLMVVEGESRVEKYCNLLVVEEESRVEKYCNQLVVEEESVYFISENIIKLFISLLSSY
jgi:hypothetical protein